MAWDANEPTDTTKIRDLGVVIRPNWEAIETADSTFKPQALNFTDRTVAGVAVDPTAIADAFISYCKTDDLGNSEFFGINDSSGVTQFTQGTPLLAAGESSMFIPGGLILKTGTASFSTTDVTDTITFATEFPTAIFGVNITLATATVSGSVAVLTPISKTSFTAKRSTSAPSNQTYYWMAWGN